MTTANNPENHQPQGGATDLGQISIKPVRLEPMRINNRNGSYTRIAVTYYGTMIEASPAPDAQISVSCSGFDACVQLTPAELRTLASQLCKAACAIEEGEREFNEQKYFGSQS
jgi:hypothetical protein